MTDVTTETVSPLRTMYNRIAQQLGEDERADFMMRAQTAIKRLEGDPATVEPRDLKSLQFIYNRMVHVYGENSSADYMKQANDALQAVDVLVKRSGKSKTQR
jgi:hypothetical protein